MAGESLARGTFASAFVEHWFRYRGWGPGVLGLCLEHPAEVGASHCLCDGSPHLGPGVAEPLSARHQAQREHGEDVAGPYCCCCRGLLHGEWV